MVKSVNEKNFKEFKDRLYMTADDLAEKDFIKVINIDAKVNLSDLSFDLAHKIRRHHIYRYCLDIQDTDRLFFYPQILFSDTCLVETKI